MRYLFVLLLSLFLIGCSLNSEEDTHSFLIVDQATNSLVNSYNYSNVDDSLVSTESYNDNQVLVKRVEYQWDGDGNLASTTENAIGVPQRTIHYVTEHSYDEDGRLVQTIRTSSDGNVLETSYGYDETHTLRGVMERLNYESVMMKDY
jgi:hypothetical protein